MKTYKITLKRSFLYEVEIDAEDKTRAVDLAIEEVENNEHEPVNKHTCEADTVGLPEEVKDDDDDET